MKQKRVMDLILLFFFGSVAGWIWEVNSIKKVACILLLILFVVDGAYSFIHPNQGNHVTYTNLIQERRIANIRKVPVR